MNNAEILEQLRAIAKLLKDRDPRVRQEGLTQLAAIDHPNVPKAYQLIIDQDKDDSTRQLAQYYLRQYQERHQKQHYTVGGGWACPVCGAENSLDDDFCQSCATPRPKSNPDLDRLKKLTPQPEAAFESDFVPQVAATPVVSAWAFDPKNERFIQSGENPFSAKQAGCGFSMSLLVSVGIGLFVFGILGVIMFFAYQDYQDALLLETEGQTVNGEVISKRVDVDSEDGDTYYVTYTYGANGQRYQDVMSVDYGFYNDAAAGDVVEVVYASSDPTVSAINGQQSSSAETLIPLAAIGICFGVPVLFFGILGIYRMGAEFDKVSELAKKGQWVDGIIVESKGYSDSDDDYWVTVQYRFVSPQTGQTITKRMKKMRNDIGRDNALPKQGDPVKVFYASDKNYRLL